MNMNDKIVQRDWDEAILEHGTPKWCGVGCYHCGSSDRMIHPIENEFEPYNCPTCNRDGKRAEREEAEYQIWLEEKR